MPTLEYICHSCVVVRTSDATLVFDPWIDGPCYHGQWHLFPKPVDIAPAQQAEVILLTHGHEDHMHRRSLGLLRKDARVFFPFQWREGISGYLEHIGFKQVTEAVTLRGYQVAPNTRVTYLAYSLESIVVIEADGQVIVNLNDALNSNHTNVVRLFLDVLKKRWPRIDVLLSGMSAASYFPNKIRYPGKIDQEVALVREQYLAHMLCTYVKELDPRLAVPFAPGFVLLGPENRWINEVKFGREKLQAYCEEHLGTADQVRFLSPYPGDRIVDGVFEPRSPYHAMLREGSLDHLIDETYAAEILASREPPPFPPEQLGDLRGRTLATLQHNSRLYDEVVLRDAIFSLRFVDVGSPFWNIRWTNGRFTLTEGAEPDPDRKAVITTRAALLEHGLERLWGADAMTIGYGLTVDMFDERSLEKNLDIVCVRLISRYPITRDDLWKQPFRALKYFATNPAITALHLKQKVTLRPLVNKFPYNERDHWISYNKCDLCRVCGIPQLGLPQAIDNGRRLPHQ